MAVESSAHTVWKGDLFSGSGRTELTSSHAGAFDIHWQARSEGSDTFTTPEELLAAAHASCFSMAFSLALAENDTPPTELRVDAKVTFVPGTGVMGSVLSVTGSVPGIEKEDFSRLAEDAKQNCPISKALGAIDIRLDDVVLEG
jgi:osmotically inducible protein OsmC